MRKTLIIAEAGVNHNGNIEIAKQLIKEAALAGADVIKFQTFITEEIVTENAEKAQYQKKNTNNTDTQFSMLKKLELSKDDHFELIEYAKKHNILFCSTAFDLDSVDLLKTLKLPFWKIPSGDITNFPYLKKIGSYNDNVIISTGMATIEEIKQALDVLINSGTKKNKITILHCNTDYPTKFEDVNLNVMETLFKEFSIDIGYSDHTLGIEVPIAAVALGAVVLEKHITLDNEMEGPDHSASIEPQQFAEMVRSIRNIEIALGAREKVPTKSEKKNIEIVRKSIVAKKTIKKGELFSMENLTVKRPGVGLSPFKLPELIGTEAKKKYLKDDLI